MTRPGWRSGLDGWRSGLDETIERIAKEEAAGQMRLSPGQRRLIMKALDGVNARLDAVEQQQASAKAQLDGHETRRFLQ